VEATPGSGGALVRIEGIFPFRPLLDEAYPLQVFVHQVPFIHSARPAVPAGP
jgi:hypothetical protein